MEIQEYISLYINIVQFFNSENPYLVFLEHHWIEIVLAAVFAILIEWIYKPYEKWQHRRKRRKIIQNKYFKFFGKPSVLKPDNILDLRGKEENNFKEYYYQREIDNFISKKLRLKENILILGNPLAGKTRSIYQALKKLQEDNHIMIPKLLDWEIEDILESLNFKIKPNTVVIFDDMDKISVKPFFNFMLQE